MTEERLNQIFDDLLNAESIQGISDVLSPLSEDDLDAVSRDFMEMYSQELAIGAIECSAWLCGNLLINANQSSILFMQTVLQLINVEAEKRRRILMSLQAAGWNPGGFTGGRR
jgi:hypothetical protein